MTYNIYQNDKLIAEGIENKEYTVTGLEPNTEYSFSVSEVIGDKESERSEQVTVTTDYSAVETVTVSPKTNNLDVGATRKLTATVEPSTAKQDVAWSSDNDEIATVKKDGTVTAVSKGETTITATAEGKTDTATVNVTQPVEGVAVSPKTVTLEVDETKQLTETISPSDASDKSVTYSSNDDEIATVDSSGLVTAVSEGEATITVTTTDGNHTDTSTINVNAPDPVE